MKNISPSSSTIKKVVCPFCSFGCEFGIVSDDFGIRGVEYLPEGSNGGRLCPRGSAASLYLNHPKRTSMPLKSGKTIPWSKITKDLKRIIQKPKSVAVTFDRNITNEEYEAITGFCADAGIQVIASSYLEPESILKGFLGGSFSLQDIESARFILVIGDPFNQSPMISKSLIDWKLADRKNRLAVVDSIHTHTASFASDFLKVMPGTESLLLLALAKQSFTGINLATVTGVAESVINDISNQLEKSEKIVILVSLPFGHTYDPLLVKEALTVLSEFSNAKIMPFVEFAGFEGHESFASVLNRIKKGTIKYLLNFGELFPFYYPQLKKSLKKSTLYCTSPIKFDDYITLPVALNLEKQGSITTTFGTKKLTGNIQPASGARTIKEMFEMLNWSTGRAKTNKEPKVTLDIETRVNKIVDRLTPSRQKRGKKIITLLGEKIAYYFLSFYEKPVVKINPKDAFELGLKSGDLVNLKSKHGSAEQRVLITKEVEPGFACVPAETPDIRGLFDFDMDNSFISFIPTEVEIWRKG